MVATGSHADTMGFRIVGAYIADIVDVGYFSIGSNIFFFNEEYFACASDAF